MRTTCYEVSLWVGLQARDHAAVAFSLRHRCAAGTLVESSASARLRYALGRGLTSLAAGRWRPLPCRRSPLPREGSACAVWQNASSVVVVGGWTDRGLSSQGAFPRYGYCGCCLHALTRTLSIPLLAVSLLQLDEHGVLQCSQEMVRRSELFSARYGHSVTACGTSGDEFYIFGGMTAGGYSGELADLGSLQAQYDEDAEPFCYWAVRQAGAAVWPAARGYHSAAASACGRYLYIFGGIAEGTACGELAVYDTRERAWTLPTPQGEAPCARFGHSATVFDGGMWVIGGSTGGDLLRSGEDLTDVWRLDLGTLTWVHVEPANEPPFPANLGRCHSAVLVGDKIVLFGGSAQTSSRVSVFNLRTLAFSSPAIGLSAADGPCKRFTHLAALVGTQMLMGFGWTFGSARDRRGCLGDWWALDLVPPRPGECRPQLPLTALEMEGDPDPDMDEDEEEDDGDDEPAFAADFNAHLAAFGQAAFADDSDGSGDEADADEYVAAATELAGRFAEGDGDDDEDEPEIDVQLERTLVHAMVLAVNAEDGVAVRVLMRRLQQLREMRTAAQDEI